MKSRKTSDVKAIFPGCTKFIKDIPWISTLLKTRLLIIIYMIALLLGTVRRQFKGLASGSIKINVVVKIY